MASYRLNLSRHDGFLATTLAPGVNTKQSLNNRIHDAVSTLTEHRDIHTRWINIQKDQSDWKDYVEKMSAVDSVGDIAHHQKCVDAYSQIIELLLELQK